MAHNEKKGGEDEWKVEDWEAIKKIFNMNANNRVAILEEVMKKSAFMDKKGYAFNFGAHKDILGTEELKELSKQLKRGNKAAYEVLLFGYWIYVQKWSEVRQVRGRRDSDEFYSKGLAALNRVAKAFDYDKGAFSNLLITALKNARKEALNTGRMKREKPQEAGLERAVPSFTYALEDKEQFEKNIEKGREVMHLIFTKIRTEVYRGAYIHASDMEKISNGRAEKSANAEVKRQGASYANEYILCEYLFGGELPESPKEYEQIGKEGVPMPQQRGRDGVLEQGNDRRKVIIRARISEMMKKSAALVTAYLAMRGIKVAAQERFSRYPLITAIVGNSDSLLAELKNDAAPKCNEIASPRKMPHDTQI